MSDDADLTRPIGDAPALPPVPGTRGAEREAEGHGSRQRPESRSLVAVLVLTVVNAVVWGTAFLASGRRRLGAAVLVLFLLLVAGGVWVATAGQRTAARLLVDSGSLTWVLAGIVVLALAWIAVVVTGYRSLLPRRSSRPRLALGALLVVALVAAIAYPAYRVGTVAVAQRGLLDGVFADDRESATVDDSVDPFGTKERVNVLLLGGDGGEGREGVRTDTVIVASIATETGVTTLFSLPRNLEDLPFPADSPLAAIYPDGFDAGSESESLLNAVYRNGPAQHPGVLGATDDPGADFLKLGVGEALGLEIDYFVLVNLDGFSRLVDALGGITVNVNYYVPVNGNPGTGELPDAYIAPGPDQRMDGTTALDFARGRFGLTDYDRMDRQRCTITAIIDAADPITLLEQYQELAATTQDIVSTDIPRTALDDFVDLAFLVKDAEVRSVVFDTSLIDPAYPDYDLVRRIVSDSLAPAAPAAPASSASSTPPAAPGDQAAGAEGDTAGQTPTPPPAAPAADVGDACAYDPVRAQEALAAGQPPTRNG
ncbi:LCP family protein required for cell wall assembly [Geodermatophilus bullaregiensis]|uniref:LCP family protein n=1 Tax=Geodermatophilus bullaregiensis TaxID=1564160 RepID=UPI0027DD8AE0|nr:LCP family protein [Geodermatophilus bullaregiensis]MBM7806479.1 LCP family protein required for cell wall assembly [Geodermatophilus bullaregiensis]